MNPVETKQADQGLEPTTGIDILDELIESCTYPGQAGILVCLKLADTDSGITDRIRAAIEPVIEKVRQMEIVGLSFECDIAPVDRWLDFMAGYTASRGPGDNADEGANLDRDKIVGEVVEILRSCQPGFLTGRRQSLHEREKISNQEIKTQEGCQDGKESAGDTDSKARRLRNLRERVEAIFVRLPLKTKCAISTLVELQAVFGCSVDVDYGNELLFGRFGDNSFVLQAREELPDDQEVAYLAEVYELSCFINQAV